MKLVRVSSNSEGTYGVLCQGTIPFAVTLERAWRDNKVGESCIPVGTYQCRKVNSPKFGATFEVCDVPGRTAILFHKGNLQDDSHGCILIGEQFNPVTGRPGITASKEGFTEFLHITQATLEFQLEIIEAPKCHSPL
jgi:hypothetical protein